jgi:hypothetical protein
MSDAERPKNYPEGAPSGARVDGFDHPDAGIVASHYGRSLGPPRAPQARERSFFWRKALIVASPVLLFAAGVLVHRAFQGPTELDLHRPVCEATTPLRFTPCSDSTQVSIPALLGERGPEQKRKAWEAIAFEGQSPSRVSVELGDRGEDLTAMTRTAEVAAELSRQAVRSLDLRSATSASWTLSSTMAPHTGEMMTQSGGVLGMCPSEGQVVV